MDFHDAPHFFRRVVGRYFYGSFHSLSGALGAEFSEGGFEDWDCGFWRWTVGRLALPGEIASDYGVMQSEHGCNALKREVGLAQFDGDLVKLGCDFVFHFGIKSSAEG